MRGGRLQLIALSVALTSSLATLGAPCPRKQAKRLRRAPVRSASAVVPVRQTPSAHGLAKAAEDKATTDGEASASRAPPAERPGDISLAVPHHFDRASARVRVGQLLQFWREAHGVMSEWRGDRAVLRGAVHGVSIDALLDVSDGAVFAVARDPGWLLRSKVKDYVSWMLKKYLHPTYQEPAEGW